MNTLPDTIPDELLAQLSQRISAEMGLEYPPDRWKDLRRGLTSALSGLGCHNESECIRQLAATPLSAEQIEVLAAHLTIGETYFWREPNTLAALHEQILPPLIHDRRRTTRQLRIWSAACSSGEEPYSIAILLERLIPDLSEWNITIQATDINRAVLRKAMAGVYSQWSFRGTPTVIKERYFRHMIAGRYEILPQIREMVKFSYGNLAQDLTPACIAASQKFDIILCRNVLIYMGATKAHEVISQLTRCLGNKGWLIVSPVETSLVQPGQLKAVNFQSATLFQKSVEETEQPRAPSPRPLKPVTKSLPRTTSPGGTPLKGTSAGDAEETFGAGPSTSTPHRFTTRQPLMTRQPLRSREVPGRTTTAVIAYTGPERRGMTAPALTPAVSALTGPSVLTARDMYARARSHADSGQLKDALVWCDKALEADRLVAGVYFLRASILQELGEGAAALQSLQRTIYLDPEFVMAHYALGNWMLMQGKPNEARLHFTNALGLLRAYTPDSLVPESEGLLAGQLIGLITALQNSSS
jgi:chemotaxis protein methyltransferase CheR